VGAAEECEGTKKGKIKLEKRARRSQKITPHLPTSHLSFLLDPSHPGETKEKEVWDFDTV